MGQRENLLGFALLFILGLTWGSSYILIKKGLIAFSPLQVAMLRFGLSGLAFAPLAFRYLFKLSATEIWRLVFVGLLGSGLPAILFALAQTRISSSAAGILSSFTPLATYFFGLLFFGLVFYRRKFTGVIIGLAGAILLIVQSNNGEQSGDVWYGALVLLATICYALNGNLIKHYFQNHSPFLIATMSFSLTGFPVFVLLFATDFTEVLATHPHGWSSLGYLAILAFVGTVAASIVFFKLVQITDALFASSVSYLVPLFAVFWGVVDGENIHLFDLVGMLLILAGIYFSRSQKPTVKTIPK
ncbi:MAG: EamA/RhaT family transporter [Saprospirales bacterium]|nr:MAG: EamA/RhaT family transporter [Saprospirales bacterium]